MSAVVIKAGLLDTIQDEGRFGFQHFGINTNGSMDLVAARVANILVGNARSDAVIELHFPAAFFMFEKNCLIALSGGDFHPVINDEPAPLNTAMIVAENSVLKFTRYVKGCRCYFAVAGGWDAALWLNSYSTNARVSAGGYYGRALKKEDVIKTKNSTFIPVAVGQRPKSLPVNADVSNFYTRSKKIRCVTGCEYDYLNDNSKNTLESAPFKITSLSDRMGYRLQGEVLRSITDQQLLSSAVTRGTVQLLPSGQLIILMADHQTTGGYPNIAHVIAADLPSLAQMQPNEELEFEMVTHADAEEIFMQQQEHLQQIEDSGKLQLAQYFGNDFDRP